VIRKYMKIVDTPGHVIRRGEDLGYRIADEQLIMLLERGVSWDNKNSKSL
jgi:hypothetical protein